MSRDLTTAMGAEIVKPVVRPRILFEGTLADGSTVRYWNGRGDLSWNGQTWFGSGQVITMGSVEETDDIQAQGTSLQINAIPPAMKSIVLQSLANGNAGIFRVATVDDNRNVIDAPKIAFRGRLDGAEIDDNDVTNPKGTLTYENELVDLERPREWRWTDGHQKKLYAGDRGLEHIAGLQDAQVPFGNETAPWHNTI